MLDPLVGQLCNKGIGLARNPCRHFGEIANEDALRGFGFGINVFQCFSLGLSRSQLPQNHRSFLLLRLCLHLGLMCPRERFATSERRLEDMKCGELRWSDRENGWEVLIPSVAFKNSGSSFFGQKPFRLILPDLLNLYKYLEGYIDRHRGVLLGPAKVPGTLFVKTVKTTSLDAAYDSTKFY